MHVSCGLFVEFNCSLKQIGYQLGADTYRGTKAFSEPETKSVSDFVLSKGTKVKAYLAVHSYGQYWLYPWVI